MRPSCFFLDSSQLEQAEGAATAPRSNGASNQARPATADGARERAWSWLNSPQSIIQSAVS